MFANRRQILVAAGATLLSQNYVKQKYFDRRA
jgi:hypothetical protein